MTNQKNFQKIIYLVIALIAVFIILFFITQSDDKDSEQCDYSSTEKNYIGKSQEECSRIQFLCVPGTERFDEECGCGCEPEPQQKNYCTEESRNADACITLYQPVCGYFDPAKITCIKFPCAETYSNSCVACVDANVEYWVEGKCPTS